MQPRRTMVIGSALVALLLTGALLRWVRVSRATEAMVFTPLARPLAELPKNIGRYRLVRDLPMANAVVDVAGVDAFVQRDYVDSASGKHMLVYVGYWGRENQGMGHGPEVCYPAVGWSSEAAATMRTVRFRDTERSAPVVMALHRFVRTEPEGIKQRAVGFLTSASGEYKPSSRGVFWHRPGMLHRGGHYLTHIQVSCQVATDNWEKDESDIVDFMEALLPHLAECLPRPRQTGEVD